MIAISSDTPAPLDSVESFFDIVWEDAAALDAAEHNSSCSTRSPSPLQPGATGSQTSRSPKRSNTDESGSEADGGLAEGGLAEGGLDPASAKRLKRMQRNRVSAASSRERKRQHIEGLERQVAELSRELAELRQVNEDLRRTCSLGQDDAPSLPADDPTSQDLDSFLKRMTCDAVAVDDCEGGLCASRVARAG